MHQNPIKIYFWLYISTENTPLSPFEKCKCPRAFIREYTVMLKNVICIQKYGAHKKKERLIFLEGTPSNIVIEGAPSKIVKLVLPAANSCLSCKPFYGCVVYICSMLYSFIFSFSSKKPNRLTNQPILIQPCLPSNQIACFFLVNAFGIHVFSSLS